MILLKGFVFKLRPTPAQEQQFRRYAGAVRWVWNEMLHERQRTYRATGKSPSMYEQKRRLPELKHQPPTAWLREIHSQVLQEPVLNLQRAFVNFFEKRAAYPRYKSKKRGLGAFTFPQGVEVEAGYVHLPKIGKVRFRQSRELEGRIKRATIIHRASGWYVSLLCEVEVPAPPLPFIAPHTTVGIDLGLKDFLVPSEGEPIPAPRFLRRLEKKLAHAQRALSRKQKGSSRYRKQVCKVARLYERVANARRDFLHKLSSALVCETQAIFAEALNVQGLARTRLAKSVHDAGWGSFLRQLAYKCAWQGKLFHQIDRFFPSTKLHLFQDDGTPCGFLNTPTLADRHFVCQGCGQWIERDRNAAFNIQWRGLQDLQQRPPDSRAYTLVDWG
jgi:putative transposase